MSIQEHPRKDLMLQKDGIVSRMWDNWFLLIKNALTSGGTITTGDITADSITLNDLTASRLVATDSSKLLVSVAALTSWIAVQDDLTITDDGDGTVTLGRAAASIIPTNYDEVEYTYGGGSLGMEPATIVYKLATVTQDTLTLVYNSDNDISTVTNSGGDVWTATYTTEGELDEWIKT